MHCHCQVAQKIGFVVLPNIGGIVGARLYPARTPWYDGLKKSKCTPPDWVFPTAWTLLYSGMGYASYVVWKEGGGFGGNARLPLMLYGSQLALNWAWTPVFFGAHNIKGGLIDMSLLVPTAAACTYAFYKIKPCTLWFMAPYLAWLGLASLLNFKIYKLNKSDNKKVIEESE